MIDKHGAITIFILERIYETWGKVLIVMIENGNYWYLSNNFICFYLTRTCINGLLVFPRFMNFLWLVADPR